MVERAKRNTKVDYLLNSVLEDITDVSKGEVTGVKSAQYQNERSARTACRRCFHRHRTPASNTDLFKGHLPLDENGYIKVTNGVHTNMSWRLCRRRRDGLRLQTSGYSSWNRLPRLR